jgi:hypothetical protein
MFMSTSVIILANAEFETFFLFPPARSALAGLNSVNIRRAATVVWRIRTNNIRVWVV